MHNKLIIIAEFRVTWLRLPADMLSLTLYAYIILNIMLTTLLHVNAQIYYMHNPG